MLLKASFKTTNCTVTELPMATRILLTHITIYTDNIGWTTGFPDFQVADLYNPDLKQADDLIKPDA